MNFESRESASETTADAVVARIDHLFDRIRAENDHKTLARFLEAGNELRAELVADPAITSLQGIPAWEKLIGGSEEETEASDETVAYVTERVADLVARFE